MSLEQGETPLFVGVEAKKEMSYETGNKYFHAIVKKTGEEIIVEDYGEKFVPRYWTADFGFMAEDLEIIGEA